MELRERIINRSIELFTSSGIRYVTMDLIAQELGISKRTIYELFRDKDHLFEECIKVMIDRHTANLNEIISHSENVIEALFLIGKHSEQMKASVNRLFFEDMDKLYPHLREKFSSRKNNAPGSISLTILKKGITEGIFNKDIDLHIVDTFIHEMMKICHNSNLFDKNVTDTEVMRNIIFPYFKGISTSKGNALIEKHLSNDTKQ